MFRNVFLFTMIICVLSHSYAFSSLESCEVGNPDHGRWVQISKECISPGPADPTSGFLMSGSTSAVRYIGNYKINTSLGVCGAGSSPSTNPDCYGLCIIGLAEHFCTPANTYYENGVCERSNGDYLVFHDIDRARLYEWTCNTPLGTTIPESNGNFGGPSCPI